MTIPELPEHKRIPCKVNLWDVSTFIQNCDFRFS